MNIKRTKIIATLGPSTHTEKMIGDILNAGADAVRLNFSHGSHSDHKLLIEQVRSVAAKIKKPVAIIQDLQGPKIRLGILPENGITVRDNDTIFFDTSIKEYNGSAFPIDYSELHNHVKPEERILLNDGKIQTKIISVDGTKIAAAVLHGGLLSSHKGINVPDSTISASALTEKDRADAAFGIANAVDYIALSFVRSADDINELRDIIAATDNAKETRIKIIAKMERPEAIKNRSEIIKAADAIMVARGDLGIEIDGARVPIVQKELIEAARLAAKPVIVATQMLDSMQENPTPTRAETGDVANAVIDHTDAVMLSNETATGKYPLETVTVMADIIRATEASPYDDALRNHPDLSGPGADVLSEFARLAGEEIHAAAIITAGFDGETARHISRSRPQVPIIAITETDRSARQLSLSSGVYAIHGKPADAESAIKMAIDFGFALECLHHHDVVLAALGEPFSSATAISVLEVKEVY